MHQLLPFIVIGLSTGAVYGLGGLGVVLTYKTSGIFNFGYGSVAALDTFVFYVLYAEHHWPWPLAAAVCLLVLAPILGLGLELIARTLASASETIKVVAMVGLILIVEAAALLWQGANPVTFPQFLPQSTVSILGVNVTWEEIIVFLFSLAASVVLYWFFSAIRLGVVMRGVVDNADLVSMSGDNPVSVRRSAWIIGTVFASIAGLMLAPSLPIDGVTLTIEVFSAFGAAAIGYFTSLPLTFAGGLLIGVAGALMDKYAATPSLGWLSGLPPALPFVVLFIVLIVMPRRRLLQRGQIGASVRRQSYYAPGRVRLGAGIIVVGLLAAVPSFQDSHIAVWSGAMVDVILFLSLGLLVRRSGQISLCQLAFAAVGAATFGHFTSVGIPWLPSLLLSALVAAPVGALIAIPAVRVSGVFLALATLGFGILMQEVFYSRGFLFGVSALGIADPRPDISIGGLSLSSDNGFFYLLLFITVLVVIATTSMTDGRLGRLLEALADSPMALETQGASTTVLKVMVFCISACFASLAGALMGMLDNYATPVSFQPFTSLTLVAVVVIVTVGDPWYALIAALGYSVFPGYVTGATTSNWLTLVFGLGAVAAAHSAHALTMPTALRRVLDRIGGRQEVRPPSGPAPVGERAAPKKPVLGKENALRRAGHPAEGLTVSDLAVSFGGVKAVNGVSIGAPMKTITGLVGPNGAGKTTTFNACGGMVRPAHGRILLHGTDVSRRGPAARARSGLGRTFQRTQLFDSLTVRQNVAMGREGSYAGRNPARQVLASPAANRAVAAAADEALALTGTTELAEVRAGLLTVGQRRLVELARVLAGHFDLLLLDEPSSGLDAHETQQFGRVLKTVAEQRGCGVLLVEHDMSLVRDICDRIYVLDFGRKIFEGTPAEMGDSEVVRAAYLGSTALSLGLDLEFLADDVVGEPQPTGQGEQ